MRFLVSLLFVGFLLSFATVPGTTSASKEGAKVSPGKGDKEKVREALDTLVQDFEYGPKDHCAIVVVSSQRMYLLEGQRVRSVFAVSTSKYGVGSEANSNKTPLGTHQVEKKFGQNAPVGTIFRARANTGKVAKIHEDPVDVEEDLITTRILWLKGLEEGLNLGKGIDSHKRMIYIHGTPEEGLIGKPASHGCIRMRNADVIELFDSLPETSPVRIVP